MPSPRHGDGLRPELTGLLDDQESKSKKRISTTPTREVETPRQKASTPSAPDQEGRRCLVNRKTKPLWAVGSTGFGVIPGTPESSMNSPQWMCFFNILCMRRVGVA